MKTFTVKSPDDNTGKTGSGQLELFAPNPMLTEDLFRAYYEARRNKRNTHNALQFELDLEHNIIQLSREIAERTYSLSKSICFIVDKPVKREIFAAHFRDRVVHHYLISKLMPIIENQLIYDTYACRKGKGTLFGMKRLGKFMRKCSNNFTTSAYILKLDIRGFFMNIKKTLLNEKVQALIRKKYHEEDKEILCYLSKTIILNSPEHNCIIKGSKQNWEGLPDSKSMFKTPADCGLPIGNLTSQVFANLYLSDLDYFVKRELKCKYYGRYVDDFFIVHRQKEALLKFVRDISLFLKERYALVLHPQKIYLQSVSKGISFLGGVIKPYRSYVGHRVKKNLFCALENNRFLNVSEQERRQELEAILNSYYGFSVHHRTCRLFEKVIDRMPLVWGQLRCKVLE